MSAFGENCVDKDMSELKKCREMIKNDMLDKTKSGIQSCISGSSETQSMGDGENTLLAKELNLREESHIDHYPALYVNKEKYTVRIGFNRDLIRYREA